MKKFSRIELEIYLADILKFYDSMPEKKNAFLGSFLDIQEMKFDFTDKVILEVGCDITLTSARHFLKMGAKHVIATNLSIEYITESDHRISLLSCDAARHNFAQQFDFIFGRAILEHISDVKSHAEMVRKFLKPTGAFFFDGSPMWDSAYGHHLWITTGSGNLYTFVENSPVYPYEHLKYDEVGLYNVLRNRLADEKEAKEIAYYVYNSPHQNRLSSNQIIKYFQDAGLNMKYRKTVGSEIPKDMKNHLSSIDGKAYSRLSIRSSDVQRN